MTARPATARPKRGRRSADPDRPAGDAGITLIEVVTAMSIMSIFMAMFTAGILQIHRFTNRYESVSTARSQIHVAFLRLDNEIRYASAISTPGTVGSDQYVEYLITNTGTPTCVELRLSETTSQLRRRQWPQGGSVSTGAWRILASGVGSSRAFTVSAADATFGYQRLSLALTASAGAGASAASAQINVTFTALNSSADTPADTVCTEARGTQ